MTTLFFQLPDGDLAVGVDFAMFKGYCIDSLDHAILNTDRDNDVEWMQVPVVKWENIARRYSEYRREVEEVREFGFFRRLLFRLFNV